MLPGRGTHITRDKCFLGRETHITRDMCFLGREDVSEKRTYNFFNRPFFFAFFVQ